MADEIIYLDLENIELYGYEREKSDLCIDAIIRGVESGDDFEAVDVFKVDENRYDLIFQGHHRAVGHYLANKPLKCVLRSENSPLVKDEDRISIKDIEIVDDKGEYNHAKQAFKNYR
jgi:hypothetical protein